MAAYDITVRVANEAALVDAITTLVTISTIVPVITRCSAPPNKKKNMSYVGGKRQKGISGVDLLEELFKKKKTRNTKELTDAFVARGFSANSMSPRLSAFLSQEKVERIGDGVYRWL